MLGENFLSDFFGQFDNASYLRKRKSISLDPFKNIVMSYNSVELERKEHIGKIKLNRPEDLNTFNSELASELIQSLDELNKDEKVRVVVISGEGKSFCAGIDLSEYEEKSSGEYQKWVELMENSFLKITEMKKSVICSVRGPAVANGVGLVASCDLAVVSEGARFGATAINVGLFCMGPAVPLSKNLTRKRCLELILTGDLIDAKTAESWGLVNRVVPEERLEEETLRLAKKLAEKSPTALQMGKRVFYETANMSYEKALDYANKAFAELCRTEDAEEGVRAFLEDREPAWED